MGQLDLFASYKNQSTKPKKDKFKSKILDLNKVYNKLSNYETGENYSPTKITFNIKPPLYMSHPYLSFDSIISMLCLRDCLGSDYFKLPSNELLNLDNLKLPIKKTEDVYHASVSLFDISNTLKLSKNRRYKRFSDDPIYQIANFKQKRISNDRGYFKDFIIDYPAILTDTVFFYSNCDIESITNLLSNLTNLGKKSSVGGGEILSFEVTETSEDYSFFKDNKPVRPIPVKLNIPFVEPGITFSNQAYKPPYFDKNNVAMCLTPQNQLLQCVEL